jgi:hypothetical protein
MCLFGRAGDGAGLFGAWLMTQDRASRGTLCLVVRAGEIDGTPVNLAGTGRQQRRVAIAARSCKGHPLRGRLRRP